MDDEKGKGSAHQIKNRKRLRRKYLFLLLRDVPLSELTYAVPAKRLPLVVMHVKSN